MSNTSEFPFLQAINSPADLRKLPETSLPALAQELRQYLIHSLDQCGGHFGANLGTVELTIALHYVYQTPEDRLVWDVGHQAYSHKVLTGRRDRLATIKQPNGLAPFPKREESEYDTFGVGHSSTSISAALGMAVGSANQHSPRHTVAVIGDGGLTGGMAVEAMNHAGALDPNLLVILNDNASTLTPAAVYKELGFNYLGPIDGHDVIGLVHTLRKVRSLEGANLLHITTTKGKGYAPAEQNQIEYHAVKPGFHSNRDKPKSSALSKPTYSDVFGQWLCDMAHTDTKLMAITPAMREGSGMVEFSQRFPHQYFDVCIAEQHALTFAAGLACEKMKPVVAIYSTFLQRAYDQLIHDIALQNLDVTLAIDRAGLVGADGPTHAGSFDLSFLRCIPNLVLMAPADENECHHMLTTAYRYSGPAAVRYPRGHGPGIAVDRSLTVIPLGKAKIVRHGKRIALLAFGSMVKPALEAGDQLDATVINMLFIKPLDTELLQQIAAEYELLVCIEENTVQGGAGSAVNEFLAQNNLQKQALLLGLPDVFLEHGQQEQMLSHCGLDCEGIIKAARTAINNLITPGFS